MKKVIYVWMTFILALLLGGSLSIGLAAERPLRWGSAGPGTGANVTVEAMIRVIEKHDPSLKISPQATAGSTENVRLLAAGEINLGIAQGDVAWKAYNGEKPFKEPIKLLALFCAYNNHQFFATVKKTGIKTMKDLEGKRVNLGPPGSGAADTCKKILSILGIKVKETYLSYADGGRALSDGTLDATVVLGIGGQPSDSLLELDYMLTEGAYIGLTEEEFAKIKKVDYTAGRVKIAKKYLKNADQDIYTQAMDLVHYATPKMEEGTGYRIVKAIFDHHEELGKYHVLGKLITPENALVYFGGIPVHPGAARYFKEKGLWKKELKVGTLQ